MKIRSLLAIAVGVLLLSTQAQAAPIITDGLVAAYEFNGNANDKSGNNNHGTVVGATPTSDRFGNSDMAYRFDGNDYILADASSLPAAERTVALWFNADQVSNRPNLVAYGGSLNTPPGKSWLMGLNHWGQSAYSVTSHFGTNTLQFVYPEPPVGQWNHFAITTSTSGTTIFVNGEEKQSNATFINNTAVAGTDLAIGVAVNRYGQAPYTDVNVGYFVGAIDDVLIYNRALSAQEIAMLAARVPNNFEPYTIGENLRLSSGYTFVLEENAQQTWAIQVSNVSDMPLSATVEIVNPHAELIVSLSSDPTFEIAGGDILNLAVLLDAGSAAVGLYEDIMLKLVVDDGSVLFSRFRVFIVPEGAEELPDLAVRAKDIYIASLNHDDTITVSADIYNLGATHATNCLVRFYEFNIFLGETLISEIPARDMRSTSISIPHTGAGDRLIQVVVDPLDTIYELDEFNNDACRILQVGSTGYIEGHILVAGTLPSKVYAGSLFPTQGSALYELYHNGVRNTDFVVKGGLVQITISGEGGEEWIYGGSHTDINGQFSKLLQAPQVPGIYRVIMTVTDTTFVGRLELVLTVVEPAPDPGMPIQPPSPPTASGMGQWYYIGPGIPGSPGGATGGEWEWIWTILPQNEPVIESDLRVYSENIHFSKNNPGIGEEITIFAEILYWAASTSLVAQNIPINFYVTYPGSPKTRIGEALIDAITVGAPDFGSSYVFTNWKTPHEGIYIVEVEIDPSYTEENMMNNAATRGIIVGALQSNHGVIAGQVFDPWGGVSNVIIELYESSGTALIGSRLTSNTGYYLFENVAVGEYQLRILTPDGFKADSATKQTEVKNQEVTSVDFFLIKQEDVVENNPPTADAGDNQTIIVPFGAKASVKLDGSLSWDPDDDFLEFFWSWDEGSIFGITPTIELPFGVHTITLVVSDGSAESPPDTVVVTVIEDITSVIEVLKTGLVYDRRAQTSSMNVSIKNISEEILNGPMHLVFDAIDPSVSLTNADGFTSDGKPYFQYVGFGSLAINEQTEAKKWVFFNPDRSRFSFAVRVYRMP